MGLYADIQNDIKVALNSDLLDAYKDFTVTKVLTSVYDPTVGTSTNTEDTKDFKGAVLKDKTGDVLDNKEELSDLKILVMDSDKPFDFLVEQKITYDTNEYRIIGVLTDPVRASWTIHCVAWN